jgi:hypothetical protein
LEHFRQQSFIMNLKRGKKNGDVAKVVGQYKAIGGRSANDRLSKGLQNPDHRAAIWAAQIPSSNLKTKYS